MGMIANNFVATPIPITGADFASALAWNGRNSSGVVLLPTDIIQIYWNDIQRYLKQDYEWTRTSTGFTIIINGDTITGFDATGANLTSVFEIDISRV
jgi:hypothetical protein